jgi:hypothetical protein
MSILHVWYNRLNPKIWEIDIWYNYWGLFDAFFFGTDMTGIMLGSATFARQMHMAAEWTNPIDLFKGHLRPYRGYMKAFADIWNFENSNPLFWILPTMAYPEFKIDRLAPELCLFK